MKKIHVKEWGTDVLVQHIKGQHGGPRTAGKGKKIGRPAEALGTNPKAYLDMLDDETIQALSKIHPIRSTAIRMLAKKIKG